MDEDLGIVNFLNCKYFTNRISDNMNEFIYHR